uniref:Uncharacterized protein n=2 Tax=Rhizophora mucronata TaxID=61149 RepID=A0A2P2JD64_RHIMU
MRLSTQERRNVKGTKMDTCSGIPGGREKL